MCDEQEDKLKTAIRLSGEKYFDTLAGYSYQYGERAARELDDLFDSYVDACNNYCKYLINKEKRCA